MNPDLSINETEKEIIEEFDFLIPGMINMNILLTWEKNLPPLDAKYKDDENRVRGCQSSVWLVADYENGKLFYQGRQ